MGKEKYLTASVPMAVQFCIDADVTFQYRAGSPNIGMEPGSQRDAQPGAAPAVIRVLSIKHAETGKELVDVLNHRQMAEFIEDVQEEFEALEARGPEGD